MKKPFKLIVSTFLSLLFIFLIIGCNEGEPLKPGEKEGSFVIRFENNSAAASYMWDGAYDRPSHIVQPGSAYEWPYTYYYKSKEEIFSIRLNATDSVNFDGFTMSASITQIEKQNNRFVASWDGHSFDLVY